MKLNEFIEFSLLSIKSGIDEFNRVSQDAKAFYPPKITFETFVDEKTRVGMGNNKIITTIDLVHYPWERKNLKEVK